MYAMKENFKKGDNKIALYFTLYFAIAYKIYSLMVTNISR